MERPGIDILDCLGKASWFAAAKSYGNTHCAFIGLIVQWWVGVSPENRWFVSSATHARNPNNKGGRQCDGLLGEGDNLVGILEVEGTRGGYTAIKLGKYFAAELEHYKSLEFAILFLYAYEPKGRGDKRAYPLAYDPITMGEVAKVSSEFPSKSIIVITLDKRFELPVKGIRTHSRYFHGVTSSIKGYLYVNGREISSRVFY